MGIFTRIWDAVPVRASKYKNALATAADAQVKTLEYIEKFTKERDQMVAMQRRYAEWMHDQFREHGGEPKQLVVPQQTREWMYIVPEKWIAVDFNKKDPTPADFKCTTKSVPIRELVLLVNLGLPNHVPPEAIAVQVGSAVTNAVLQEWREQSALLAEAVPRNNNWHTHTASPHVAEADQCSAGQTK